MFPFYLGYIPGLTLYKDDVEGIQQLYGKINILETTSISLVGVITGR